ncbi:MULTISPECIES: YlaH-like family protein [Cohnella]|uniref:YlaH-like family protein n=1 Tax=Cohnella TaxID=329857 RepID=UPI0009BB03E5|nr:YlaH-like family protein [Cohnella massiliensis]MBN2983347.1 YlaH-like family protein [Cohnella algarum]
MQTWFQEHPLISYILILAFTIYIFNAVFRPGRLPILKEILVYVMMALGCLVLLVLQIDKLPIIQCMGVAVIMMLMLRLRQLYDKLRKPKDGGDKPSAEASESR